jgi:hypothetical protein
MQFKNEFLKQVLVGNHTQNLDRDDYFEELLQQQQQQNYFVICESCFWMASILGGHPSDHTLLTSYFTECPICENKLDRFAIPTVSY